MASGWIEVAEGKVIPSGLTGVRRMIPGLPFEHLAFQPLFQRKVVTGTSENKGTYGRVLHERQHENSQVMKRTANTFPINTLGKKMKMHL